jgi:hypothetical protein
MTERWRRTRLNSPPSVLRASLPPCPSRSAGRMPSNCWSCSARSPAGRRRCGVRASSASVPITTPMNRAAAAPCVPSVQPAQGQSRHLRQRFSGKEALLQQLGRHTCGLAQCLYLEALAEVDLKVLAKIIQAAWMRHARLGRSRPADCRTAAPIGRLYLRPSVSRGSRQWSFPG